MVTSIAEKVNKVLKEGKVSSVDELAEKLGLSRYYLFRLERRGLIPLLAMHRGERRGKPSDIYGPIAENLGVVEMLAYWGFPSTVIADEIGVTKAAVWEYLRNRQELYNLWRKARENYDEAMNERFKTFKRLSGMGLPRNIMARELGIKPGTTYYHHKRHPELYEAWKRERWGDRNRQTYRY